MFAEESDFATRQAELSLDPIGYFAVTVDVIVLLLVTWVQAASSPGTCVLARGA